MSNLMTSSVNFFKLRTVALNLANKSPIMTALAARLLFLIAALGILLTTAGIVFGTSNGAFEAAFNLATAAFSFVVSWALLGASKEVYCRRQGLPVHPW